MIATIISMLAGKGLDLVKGAIEGGADKATEFVRERTGIDLTKQRELSAEDITKLKHLEFNSKLELEKLALSNKKEDNRHEESQEININKRWESDNDSDSRIAKLVRPLLVIFLVLICTILSVIDGNIDGFAIKEAWVTLFTSLAVTAVSGYFVLRTYEKRTNTSKWNK